MPRCGKTVNVIRVRLFEKISQQHVLKRPNQPVFSHGRVEDHCTMRHRIYEQEHQVPDPGVGIGCKNSGREASNRSSLPLVQAATSRSMNSRKPTT